MRCIITPATSAEQLAVASVMIREYAAGLGVDLCFQGFEAELATLPGAYAPPAGALLLAQLDGIAVGCVACRPAEGGSCELKRLYVRPAARGAGVGRQLVTTLIAIARGAWAGIGTPGQKGEPSVLGSRVLQTC